MEFTLEIVEEAIQRLKDVEEGGGIELAEYDTMFEGEVPSWWLQRCDCCDNILIWYKDVQQIPPNTVHTAEELLVALQYIQKTVKANIQ